MLGRRNSLRLCIMTCFSSPLLFCSDMLGTLLVFVVVLTVLASREMHLGKCSLPQHFGHICTGQRFTEVSNGWKINKAFQIKLHFCLQQIPCVTLPL